MNNNQPDEHGFVPNKYNNHIDILGEPEIGEETWIGSFCVIDGSGGLKIGKGCGISRGVHIYTHSTAYNTLNEWKGKWAKPNIPRKPTEIEDYVYIGANAIILMGCKIGHHTIIGAGAVVLENTKIPPYSVVVGVPAKIVKKLTKKEIENYKS